MQTIELHSWLSGQIDRFIDLRRLSGSDYSSQARLLGYFDRFLVEQYPNESFITRHMIDHYLQSLSHLRPRVRLNRFCVVRLLCRYIALTEPRCHVPESFEMRYRTKGFSPLYLQRTGNRGSALRGFGITAGRVVAAAYLPDSPLFINLRSHGLRHCTVYQAFRQLLEKCGIVHSKYTGPRIHDLRHTFAVHRLLAWYRDNQDVNARLPALATYMGHVAVCSTHVYLRPTAELLEQVNDRFHNHYLHSLKAKGGIS